MHPTVLFFVLLFIPGTDLSDWQSAPAPVLHELMRTGALGLMNARTAEHDRITEAGGEQTIFAGARMTGQEQPIETLDYSARPNNLTDAARDKSGVRLVVVDANCGWPDTDTRIAAYVRDVRKQHGILLVVSPNPSVDEYRTMHQLTPALLWGEDVPVGLLTSPSTRNRGLIVNTDIAPTVAGLVGATLPGPAYGAQITVGPSHSDNARFLMGKEKGWVAQANALKLLPYIAAFIALAIVLCLFPTGSRIIATFLSLVPFALLLSHSGHSLLFAVIVALLVAVLSRGIAWPAIAAAFVIWLGLTIDAACVAGTISGFSLLGYSPIEGARYYGIGNEAMGVYVGSLVVLTDILAKSKKGRWFAFGLWIIAGLAMALPWNGAKAGGLIVCAAALAASVCLRSGWRLKEWRTVAAIAASVLLSVGLLVVISHFGPRTHVTQTVTMAKSGGLHVIFQTIFRKAAMDLHLVFHSVWIWVLLLTSYGRFRLLKSGPISGVGTVATLACLFFNDAGVVAAALCGLIVWSNEFLSSGSMNLSARATPITR